MHSKTNTFYKLNFFHCSPNNYEISSVDTITQGQNLQLNENVSCDVTNQFTDEPLQSGENDSCDGQNEMVATTRSVLYFKILSLFLMPMFDHSSPLSSENQKLGIEHYFRRRLVEGDEIGYVN